MTELLSLTDAQFDAVTRDRLDAMAEAKGTPHFEFALARCEALVPVREARQDAIKTLIEKLEFLA